MKPTQWRVTSPLGADGGGALLLGGSKKARACGQQVFEPWREVSQRRTARAAMVMAWRQGPWMRMGGDAWPCLYPTIHFPQLNVCTGLFAFTNAFSSL